MRLFLLFLIILTVFFRVVLDSETFRIVSIPKEEGLYTVSRFEWNWGNFSKYLDVKYEEIGKSIYLKFHSIIK